MTRRPFQHADRIPLQPLRIISEMRSLSRKFLILAAVGGMLALILALGLGLTWKAAPGGPAAQPAPTASSSDARVLRFGLNIAAGSALHAAALRFAQQVETGSQGRLRISVHPDQQLGNDDQMLEMARAGTLDLLLTPTAKLSSAIPAMQYADLPFYFSSREELYAMLDGEPGRMLLSKLNSIDLIGLTFWENGFKQFTANTPILHPQDFAHLRIRTMKSPMIADQFASLGATPIPIDFHATYQALADGAVDGQENPLVAIVGMRLHQVQKHLTLSNHAYLGYVFSISKRSFESLPPELRRLLEDTARELTTWEREETARREQDFLREIEAAGVQVHTLTGESRAAFRQAMAPIADKFAFTVGYDLLAKTDELRFRQQMESLPAQSLPLVVGLSADLSRGGAQGGGAIYRGLQMAVEEINRKGGVLGRPLTIIARDHAGNPLIGRHDVEELARLPNLLAIVGGMHSAVIAESLADIHTLQIPFLIPWAASPQLTVHEHRPSYTFRVSIGDDVVAPFLLERALKIGPRVAVLLERSTWGRGNEEVLRPLLNRLPSGHHEIFWLETGESQNQDRLSRFPADQFDVVVLVANPVESAAVVRSMARRPRPLPIVAHWGLTGGDFFTPMQEVLERIDLRFVQSVLADESGAHPRLPPFLARYRERYGLTPGTPLPSMIGSVHAYDLMHLLAKAVQRAGSPERTKIRTALEQLPRHDGLLRTYAPAFSPTRHDALDSSLLHLARFDRQGNIVRAD